MFVNVWVIINVYTTKQKIRQKIKVEGVIKMTKTTVAHSTATRWGNAVGFRIPKALQSISTIYDKTKIKIEAEPNRLIITKIPERLTLEEIFCDWNGEEYDTYDWGELDKPVGREMI